MLEQTLLLQTKKKDIMIRGSIQGRKDNSKYNSWRLQFPPSIKVKKSWADDQEGN